MKVNKVYILWWGYPDRAEENNIILGIYSSKEIANEKIENKYKALPGFNKGKGEFTISEYKVNEDHWEEGFFTPGEDENT